MVALIKSTFQSLSNPMEDDTHFWFPSHHWLSFGELQIPLINKIGNYFVNMFVTEKAKHISH